jgi:large subunit ribosomal protein L13
LAVAFSESSKSEIEGNKMKTTVSAKPHEVKREWLLVDATDKTLGRLATEIASRLRGKHKPIYTPHVDTGDYIVVINAEKVAVTGNKARAKMYHRHSGYIGGLKSKNFETMIEDSPEKVLELAVKGMLPRNPLGRAMFTKLKVYSGSEHPHTAQQPQPLSI